MAKKAAPSPATVPQAPDLDIDLAAALPQGPPTTPPKRGRGRPRSTAPKPPPPPRKYKTRKDKGVRRKPPPTPPEAPIYINIGGDIDNIYKGDKSKGKLSDKELIFLEIYLKGGMDIEKAMIQAGYGELTPEYRYSLARKIVARYESQAQDARNIFRAMGAGEVAVVQGLLKLAQGSKSDMVRLNAWSMIAKCIGLTKEQLEGAGGITIIFEQPDGERPASVALPAQGELVQPTTYQQPVKVLQITK